MVITVNLKLALESQFWPWVSAYSACIRTCCHHYIKGASRDHLGQHSGVVHIPLSVLPFLAHVPYSGGDGGRGYSSLQLLHLLWHLCLVSLPGHVA